MEYNDNAEPVLLCTLVDDAQAGIVLAALKEQGIPVVVKFAPGPSLSVIIGYTYKDIRVYIPPRFVNDAKEILDIVMGDALNTPQEHSFDKPIHNGNNGEAVGAGDSANKSHTDKLLHIVFYILLLIFIGIPLIICLAYGLIIMR